MEIKSFRDLVVWQKGMNLVERVYSLTKQFPADERYALTSQIKRASVSVPSNIAEGYGRSSTADYIRFLKIALGSLYEIDTQLELATRLGFGDLEDTKAMLALCSEIEKMLVVLISRLRTKVTNP